MKIHHKIPSVMTLFSADKYAFEAFLCARKTYDETCCCLEKATSFFENGEFLQAKEELCQLFRIAFITDYLHKQFFNATNDIEREMGKSSRDNDNDIRVHKAQSHIDAGRWMVDLITKNVIQAEKINEKI